MTELYEHPGIVADFVDIQCGSTSDVTSVLVSFFVILLVSLLVHGHWSHETSQVTQSYTRVTILHGVIIDVISSNKTLRLLRPRYQRKHSTAHVHKYNERRRSVRCIIW